MIKKILEFISPVSERARRENIGLCLKQLRRSVGLHRQEFDNLDMQQVLDIEEGRLDQSLIQTYLAEIIEEI